MFLLNFNCTKFTNFHFKFNFVAKSNLPGLIFVPKFASLFLYFPRNFSKILHLFLTKSKDFLFFLNSNFLYFKKFPVFAKFLPNDHRFPNFLKLFFTIFNSILTNFFNSFFYFLPLIFSNFLFKFLNFFPSTLTFTLYFPNLFPIL